MFASQMLPSLGLLAQGNVLEELWLSANSFSCTGAAALSSVLPLMPCLVKLDLRFNSIGDIGASAIATALPQVQKADAVTDASNARPQPVRKLALRNHRAVLMRVWCRCNSAADSSV